MHRNITQPFVFLILIVVVTALACNMPTNTVATPTPTHTVPSPLPVAVEPSATAFSGGESNLPTLVVPTATPEIIHTMTPSNSPGTGALIYDVESSGTAPEKRAPYGDSYDINRLERPFQQDMTYIPDMDIVTYNVSNDDTWTYVSIELIGTDPNNTLGINYGVEIDDNADGFGDYIIVAHPPYTPSWDVTNVQIYADKNHDTGGLSAEHSDAPFDGDGYETLIYDGGIGNDPDLAWVRFTTGTHATVQFAFKRSFTDGAYMLGVLADAGLKNVGMLDYVDRFTEEEAGSPEKSKKYYPLKALYAVDNVCREAFGFSATGYEPQLCPRDEQSSPRKPQTQTGCQNPSQYHDQASCVAAGCSWVHNPNVVVAVVYYCTGP